MKSPKCCGHVAGYRAKVTKPPRVQSNIRTTAMSDDLYSSLSIQAQGTKLYLDFSRQLIPKEDISTLREALCFVEAVMNAKPQNAVRLYNSMLGFSVEFYDGTEWTEMKLFPMSYTTKASA